MPIIKALALPYQIDFGHHREYSGITPMKLFRTSTSPVVAFKDRCYCLDAETWDQLLAREGLCAYVAGLIKEGAIAECAEPTAILPPVESQEIWAAGVTYMRSREARMEESKDAGGGDFYDRVYSADRPELFFKSPGHRAIGQGGNVRLRMDANWSVPEPELVLVISPMGKIQGYTIGNDMSSRDIEGENPLYLPQAKTYNGSCAIGPCIYLTDEPLPPTTEISIKISRSGVAVFDDKVEISRIKRTFSELAGYLYRELSFPTGAFLMTGTGVVPDASFTLASGDVISITIAPVGTLTNTVE